MYTDELIQTIFGEDALTYIKNKNRGGTNNNKGKEYEDFFAIYKLSEIAKQIVEEGIDAKFFSQLKTFVDDLVIDFPKLRIHYQLKNKEKGISWGNSDTLKSIAYDFYSQYRINETIELEETQLCLVTNNKTQQIHLSKTIPSEIKNYTSVFYFYYSKNINEIIEAMPDFKESISYLSAFDKPEPDKIECVATVLLGAWYSIDTSEVSVSELLHKAQTTQPSYIRLFSSDIELDLGMRSILDRIPRFQYNVSKGFLHWDYADGLDTGTIYHDIESSNFKKIQDLIKQFQPTSFEDLEKFLI